jgi:putative transposase
MKYDPLIHGRRSIRLRDYDYSQAGSYYVTICSRERRCIFGQVRNTHMSRNRLGEIVAEEWLRICDVRPEVTLDEWQVMPNHLHGIIVIGAVPGQPPPVGLNWPAGNIQKVGATQRVAQSTPDIIRATRWVAPTPRLSGPKSGSIAAIISQFKSNVTKLAKAPPATIWQRNYYEHVIRDEVELHNIRLYIAENPIHWDQDPENSQDRTIMGKRRGDSPSRPK